MDEEQDVHSMTVVHRCWNDGEADIVISFLRAHGIEATANSEIPHTILPLVADGLGEVQIQVRLNDAEAAMELLRDQLDQLTRGEVPDTFPDA